MFTNHPRPSLCSIVSADIIVNAKRNKGIKTPPVTATSRVLLCGLTRSVFDIKGFREGGQRMDSMVTVHSTRG
jgi:hypothetical protein